MSEQSCRRLHRQRIRPLSTRAPLASAPPSLGAKYSGQETEKHTLQGHRANSSPTLRASAPAAWLLTSPLTVWRWPLSREEVPPHTPPRTGSSPSISSHIPYQGDSGQHTLRKDVTGVHIKSSSHSKDTGQTVCIVMPPHGIIP